MIVFSDPSVARYHTPGHPEAPFRVSRTAERLAAAGLGPALPDLTASEEDVLLAHEKEHLETLRSGELADPETPRHPRILAIAMTSLSGALSAAAAAAGGRPAFSLMRPPGHHAGRRVIAGFCYLNNVATASLRLLKDGRAARVAILDIDVHHGDGTEDIVRGRPDVRFCSLHQSPLYPGTGTRSEGNCRNVPLPAGTGEDRYLPALESALEDLLAFRPDALAVSAGFDTYEGCPIAGLKLKKGSYRRIGRMIAQSGLARFAALEGGYAEEVPALIEEFLEGFAG